MSNLLHNYFGIIPIELNSIICNHLNLRELDSFCKVVQVCRRSDFWRELFLYRFGNIDKRLLSILKDIDYKEMFISIINYVDFYKTPINMDLIISNMKNAMNNTNVSEKEKFLYKELVIYIEKQINVKNILHNLDYSAKYPNLNDLNKNVIIFMLNKKLFEFLDVRNMINMHMYDSDIVTEFINNYDIDRDFVEALNVVISEMIKRQKEGKLSKEEVNKWVYISDMVKSLILIRGIKL